MKVITGTVVRGKIAIPAGSLTEGVPVAILAPDPDSPVQLTRSEEEELEAAVAELDRGEFVDGMDLLSEIRRRSEV